MRSIIFLNLMPEGFALPMFIGALLGAPDMTEVITGAALGGLIGGSVVCSTLATLYAFVENPMSKRSAWFRRTFHIYRYSDTRGWVL